MITTVQVVILHMNSVILQLPALISPGITLVISPLVSLIQDQIMHLLQVTYNHVVDFYCIYLSEL